MTTALPALEARVRLHVDNTGHATRLLAYAELTIADAFVIKGIRVLAKRYHPGDDPADEEPFIVFPAEQGKAEAADRWYDLAHPITPEARTAATTLILEQYAKAKAARP